LGRVVVEEVFHFELLQSIPAAAQDFHFPQSCRLLQRKSHIFQSGEGIEQRVALKQKTTPSAEFSARGGIARFQFLSVEADSPGVWLQDVCETFQEDGFPSATRAKDGKNTATRNFQIHPPEHGFSLEAFLQALDMKSDGVLGSFHSQIKNELMM
jgi:hypothetical protein